MNNLKQFSTLFFNKIELSGRLIVFNYRGLHMANISDVAKYFLQKDLQEDDVNSITNLKLQKLVYYAQGFHLAIYNVELFEDDLEAWMHGPVAPALYREFKSYGKEPIVREDDRSIYAIFSEEENTLLDDVFSEFGQFTAWKLRNMTHEESPWLDNFGKGDNISKAELMKYFTTQLN